MGIKFKKVSFIAILIIAGCASRKDIGNGTVSAIGVVNKTVKHEPLMFADKGKVKVVIVKNVDINGDGKIERIEYTAADLLESVQTITLKINEIETSFIASNPSLDFNIIEINIKDKFKVIDIFEDGPSGDPKSTLFIYDGKTIQKIGELQADEYNLDGLSKIWTPFDTISFLDPKINLGWTEMNDRQQLIYKQIDKRSSLNKRYRISVAQDSVNSPRRIYKTLDSDPYGEDFIAEVRVGDEVTVTDIKKQDSKEVALRIKLDDGKEGWMIHIFGGD